MKAVRPGREREAVAFAAWQSRRPGDLNEPYPHNLAKGSLKYKALAAKDVLFVAADRFVAEYG